MFLPKIVQLIYLSCPEIKSFLYKMANRDDEIQENYQTRWNVPTSPLGILASLFCIMLFLAWTYASTRGLCYLTESSGKVGYMAWFFMNWMLCGFPAVFATIMR